MASKKIGVVVTTMIGMFLLGLVMVSAQQNKNSGCESHAAQNAAQEAKTSAGPIFCPAKSSGQLCDHGTADRLKLGGQNRERWDAVVRRYNEQVESAQKQLIEEARGFLTPEEAKQVESYFAPAKNRATSPPTTSASKPGSVTIKVEGMTCGGCAVTVEKALKKTPGVEDAKVSYEKGEAWVKYDDAKVTLAKLREVINNTGFKAGEAKEEQ
jgi:copper chaperone